MFYILQAAYHGGIVGLFNSQLPFDISGQRWEADLHRGRRHVKAGGRLRRNIATHSHAGLVQVGQGADPGAGEADACRRFL